ncbi:hypothetical protein PTSG_10021 [Salpingoeca rosetta]|uniref:Inositol polyphosphate-related phosphatase domain-containing protein n=1 Tax=Salpingoeca rosetta (strain ATCC 50818 / BSB-021) TaxID=946362 RepID=F2UPA0_SALR5|nr:uncharacterized protein PTSG_10021 [Salpingoeca rosetta]EGD79455.1 hypothetical protein PTSG_10021 [Salpingoeca rosetta]|eukprot:XP_004988936.1 hypothetical protein PTSG_10021 [Salpingoeca rosetta]
MGAHASVPEIKREKLSCFICTWNLGNEAPEPLDWIPKGHFDMYVIGVQESCYTPKGHEGEKHDDVKAEYHWQQRLDDCFGEEYECLAYQTLSPRTDKTYKTETSFKDAVVKGEAKSSGIRLAVYVSKRLRTKEFQIEHEVLFQTCGRLNGASGNKGGVAINLNINGARISFVNCHLNAHMQELPRRNEDYDQISRYLHRTDDLFGERKRKLEESGDLTFVVEVENRHDAVFWFGDLNYRLQPLDDLDLRKEMHDIVCKEIDRQNWEGLMDFDQLKKQQKLGLVLAGFEEEEIRFPPTFKFARDPSSRAAKSGQERDVYVSKRVPSYCDRILYRANEGATITCTDYTYNGDVTSSDHRPVMASFELNVPMVSSLKRHTLAKPRALRLELSNLILRTEASHNPANDTDTPVTITIYHRHANTRINTNACAKPKRVWDGPFVLESSTKLDTVLLYPVLFLIRDRSKKEADQHCLGEGMLSLLDLTSRPFKTEVYQGGKPYGLLAGQVEFSFV